MNALQGFHDQNIANPMTDLAHRVTNVEEIPRLVVHAYRTASSGVEGTVLLDFPVHVFFAQPHFRLIAYGILSVPTVALPAPDPVALNKMVDT